MLLTSFDDGGPLNQACRVWGSCAGKLGVPSQLGTESTWRSWGHAHHGQALLAFKAPAPSTAHGTAAYLRDAGVRALAVCARQLQPLALVDGAVLPQCALALALAPSALEVWICLEAQAAALTHGSTLVEMHCGQKAEALWGGVRGREGLRSVDEERGPSLWDGTGLGRASGLNSPPFSSLRSTSRGPVLS